MNDEKVFNFDIISVIMKKNVLFALMCACVMGFTVSSCSSDENDERDERVYENVKAFRKYTDHISDVVNEEYGLVCKDYFDGCMFIDAENGNRYYLATAVQSMLEEAGILVEGNKVKFSGKVYDTDDRWIPGLEWRLENYGWNEGAKEAASNGLYNYELPTAGQTFWLVTPDFTITKAE